MSFITPIPDSDPPQWEIDPTELIADAYIVDYGAAEALAVLLDALGVPAYGAEVRYAIAPRRTTMVAMSTDGTTDGTPVPETALCDVHDDDAYQIADTRRWAAENGLNFLEFLDFTEVSTLACRVCGGVVEPEE